MALFKGKDAHLSVLTRFYQIKIDAGREDGGDLLEFWSQIKDTQSQPPDWCEVKDTQAQLLEEGKSISPQDFQKIMPKEMVEAAERFQDFVRTVMDDMYAYGMVNIGALEQINNGLRYHTPFFAYYFDPLSLQEDTAVGFNIEKISRRTTGEIYYVKGPFLKDQDLSGYYVPLNAIMPDRQADDVNGLVQVTILDALRDVLYNQKAVGKCLSCGSVFIVSRPDKVYCSHRCAARVSIRQKRAAKQNTASVLTDNKSTLVNS